MPAAPTHYRLGAALVADYHVQSTISRTYLQTIYNPLCPVRYEDPTSKPDNWNDVSVSDNHAQLEMVRNQMGEPGDYL